LVVAQEDGANDTQSTPSTQQSEHGRDRGMSPAKRVERLTRQLSLTSDQQSKVQGILQQQQASMRNLRQDSSLSPQDRRAKMMDMRSTTDSQIRALLTGDQQQKWDQMQKNRQPHGSRQHRDSDDDDADQQLTYQS
jgi:hypothetical protein